MPVAPAEFDRQAAEKCGRQLFGGRQLLQRGLLRNISGAFRQRRMLVQCIGDRLCIIPLQNSSKFMECQISNRIDLHI